MTTRPTQCTHLLAPHLVRTEKFLCALATAPYILEASWATNSASAKRLLRRSTSDFSSRTFVDVSFQPKQNFLYAMRKLRPNMT
jgi:hypothetical protein